MLYGTDPQRVDRMAVEKGGNPAYHYVEVSGLRPGVTLGSTADATTW